jgi:galactokinase
VLELFVPGRLCLFGEHTDWAGTYRLTDHRLSPGQCLVTGTDQGLHAEVDRLADVLELTSVLPDGSGRGPERIAADQAALAHAAAAGGFFSYAAGVGAEVTARHRVGGLRVTVAATDLPVAKGLSSSAAVCVLVARAYNRCYRLGLSTRDEMELAYAGERRAGSACGRMDQVCAFGQTTVLLIFDGEDLAIEPLLPGATFWLLIVDLGGKKDTRRILADLRAAFPDAAGPVAAGVREALGPANAALLVRARAALETGDAKALGLLMCEAQRTFDRLVAPASAELAAPRLHTVLAHAAVRELAWGGKGVGSQGDGSAQLVSRGPAERAALAARLEKELGMRCLPLTIGSGAR